MARAPASRHPAPLQRAADDLVRRFRAGAHNVAQPLLLVDPPGYGAGWVLEEFVDALALDPALVSGFKVGSTANRPDAIDNLTALLVEVAAIASADLDELAEWRRRLRNWQGEREPSGFRAELDRYLADIFIRVPGVILCVPRIDRILTTLVAQNPREDWQLRGYVNNYPIRLVGSAPRRLQISADDAFFQTFWPISPHLYEDEDLVYLASRLRLNSGAAALLTEIAPRLGQRPELVERAAGLLALNPRASGKAALRAIANAPPAALIEQLESASRQALKVLAHLAAFAAPVDAGTVASAANVSGNVVSTQMGRLAELGLVKVARSAGRDHHYAFADPVSRTLYRAMVGCSDYGVEALVSEPD